MQKIRYEVDPHNKLTRLGPGKFRTVIDGEFKLDDGNKLVLKSELVTASGSELVFSVETRDTASSRSDLGKEIFYLKSTRSQKTPGLSY